MGSGLSMQGGLPSWSDLADILSVECKSVVENNQFSQAKLEGLYKRMKIEGDLWRKFSLIKEILGDTSFSASIKEALSTEDIQVPELYNIICRLNISGCISLNIDSFLQTAMSSVIKGQVYPVYGADGAGRLADLTRKRPFLYQPHGSIAAESSWVFTYEEFKKLTESALHREFLTSVFLRDIVVFVGIQADDIGASLRLVDLNDQGLRTGSHYWIATNSHAEKREWAERNGVQQILYPPELGHEVCLEQIIKAVGDYVSKDDIISAPVVGFKDMDASLSEVSPGELFKLDDIDEIRLTLRNIIRENSVNGDISYEKYSEICQTYARAIHSCYMMPSGDGGERWFGYEITGQALGGKTMGRVMPARDQQGRSVAIKILDQRRYSDELYLSAFRRGIKALRILADRGVKGIITVHDAYEVPPTIVMDFLNCASLKDAILTGSLPFYKSINVVNSVSETVLQAHLLPEIVLHRDIRPSNILLAEYDWEDGSYNDVKVIDFDLAWHRGAMGDDFLRSDRDSLGFQAPEQLVNADSSLRRTTLIDSYGLGATLYFCLAGENPPVNAHSDADFAGRTFSAARRKLRNFPELSSFVARTVLSAMAASSSERISVSEIRERLNDTILWVNKEYNKCSSDFICEMICAISSPDQYISDERGKIFRFYASNGLAVSFRNIFIDSNIEVDFLYEKPKNVDNGRADKTLNRIKADFFDLFSNVHGAACRFRFSGSRSFEASVVVGMGIVSPEPNNLAKSVSNVVSYMNIQ